jgi:hypothetical protein
LRAPQHASLARIAEWNPPSGVLSVYVNVHPGDRGEGWRLALNEELDRVLESGGSGPEAKALRATVERARAHFPAHVQPTGISQIGFLEVAEDAGQEAWLPAQIELGETRVVHAPRAHLRPLVELVDEGRSVGVAAVSAERVRVLEWGLGFLDELDEWELGVWRGDWHERKARVPRLGGRGTAISSSGKDQHDQLLEANRERFLQDAGRRIGEVASERRWGCLVAFGEGGHLAEVTHRLPDELELLTPEQANLVHEDRPRMAERVREAVAARNRRRELDLVERARAAALSSQGRGALGLEPTRAALTEGRVAHLVIDAERDRRPAEREDDGGLDAELAEKLIQQALRTGAAVTPVEGEAADALHEHGGVAALLRY